MIDFQRGNVHDKQDIKEQFSKPNVMFFMKFKFILLKYKGFMDYFKDGNKDVWTQLRVENESKQTTMSCAFTVAINKNL